MKYLIRVALALPLLILLGGPARTADEKAPDATPYYPLKVGDTWNYRMGDSKYTSKVTKIEEKDKQPCARVEITAGGKLTSVEYVKLKADGVYRYEIDANKAEPPVCFLKLPPKTGETWKIDSKVGPGKVTGTFKSGEEATLKVGDKTYEKVVTVTSEDLSGGDTVCRVTYYFAKDVGMVKQTLKIGTTNNEVVIELESFEAGK